MNKAIITILVIVVVVGGAWWIVFSQQSTRSQVTVTPPVPGPVPPVSSVPVSSVKEFTVTGSNFAFAPNTISVKKGDTVKITFKNADGMHDFKIDEFGVATNKISGGQSDVVSFVADKSGSFEFYCSIGKHRALGMKGTLVVK